MIVKMISKFTHSNRLLVSILCSSFLLVHCFSTAPTSHPIDTESSVLGYNLQISNHTAGTSHLYFMRFEKNSEKTGDFHPQPSNHAEMGDFFYLNIEPGPYSLYAISLFNDYLECGNDQKKVFLFQKSDLQKIITNVKPKTFTYRENLKVKLSCELDISEKLNEVRISQLLNHSLLEFQRLTKNEIGSAMVESFVPDENLRNIKKAIYRKSWNESKWASHLTW